MPLNKPFKYTLTSLVCIACMIGQVQAASDSDDSMNNNHPFAKKHDTGVLIYYSILGSLKTKTEPKPIPTTLKEDAAKDQQLQPKSSPQKSLNPKQTTWHITSTFIGLSLASLLGIAWYRGLFSWLWGKAFSRYRTRV